MARGGLAGGVEGLFRDEVARAERLGVDEAVRRTSRRLLAGVDRAKVAAVLARARRRTGLRGSTPAEALSLYRAATDAYLAERSPALAWLLRQARRFLGLDHLRPSLGSPERVEWAVATGRRCPLLAACGWDVSRCEPFCRAHFGHGTALQPEATVLLGMLDPPMRFELARMRRTPEEPCVYAIVRGRPPEG